MKKDIVVIGSGASGFTSAIALAESGKNVTIISSNVPATVLFSGASYRFTPPEEQIEVFTKSVEFFKKIINSAGYPLSQKKATILNESGGIIETSLFSSPSTYADLNFILNKKVLFIGIENLQNFIPELFIMRLKKYIKDGTHGWSHITINLPFASDVYSSITLAKALDSHENFEEFKNQLLNINGIQNFDVILIPPVSGIKNYNENYNELKEAFKPLIGELLSSIPSVNGLRLLNTMEKALSERNLKVISGKCTGFTGNKEIKSINVVTPERETLQIEGNNFIYAPGKFIGGGISSGKEVRETLFGLPLYYNEKPLNSSFHSLFSYNLQEIQPGLHARIAVNEKMQPLTENGNILAENLFAAGSIISNNLHDGITEAIFSGYLCGRAIV